MYWVGKVANGWKRGYLFWRGLVLNIFFPAEPDVLLCVRKNCWRNKLGLDDSMPSAPHSKWNSTQISKQTILNRISLSQRGIHKTGCIRLHTSTGDSYFCTWLRDHCGKRWRPSPRTSRNQCRINRPLLCVLCSPVPGRENNFVNGQYSFSTVCHGRLGSLMSLMPCSKSNLFFLWQGQHIFIPEVTCAFATWRRSIMEYPYVFQVHSNFVIHTDLWRSRHALSPAFVQCFEQWQ